MRLAHAPDPALVVLQACVNRVIDGAVRSASSAASRATALCCGIAGRLWQFAHLAMMFLPRRLSADFSSGSWPGVDDG
jgi:hypothetical protein